MQILIMIRQTTHHAILKICRLSSFCCSKILPGGNDHLEKGKNNMLISSNDFIFKLDENVLAFLILKWEHVNMEMMPLNRSVVAKV